MKAAIYNRKSTDTEDKQVLSLESQRRHNGEAISRSDDELVDTYEESRSAKDPGKRSEFDRMITDIQAGNIEVIYCWKLNRLARNPIDGGKIQWLLQQDILKKIVTSERTYLPSDNVLQMMVELGMAIQSSRDLGKDAKRGMREKAKMGWFPGLVPIGYLNSYGQKGEKYVLVDPDRFDTVRRCWDLLLTGTKTVKQIHHIATDEWGLTRLGSHGRNARVFSLSAMYTMFSNVFYCGQFQWDGEIWQGKHEPMVTMEEFDRAQEILGPRGKPRLSKNQNIYSGLIQCGCCGSAVIMDVKRKMLRTTGEVRVYYYFRCSKSGKKATCCTEKGSVSDSDILDQVYAILDSIEIPQAFVEWMLDELQLSQNDSAKMEARDLKRIQKNYKDANEKVNRLMKRQLDPSTEVSEDLFKSMLKELEAERDRWKTMINDFHATVTQRTTDTVEAVNFAKDLRSAFAYGDRDARVAILRRIGQSIELQQKVLTFRLAKPFDTFKKCNEKVVGKIGSIEPLKVGLQTVNSSVLEQVIPIWYPGEDSNL
tara:strand:- start:16 stop:1629 length:1614 start_codon:yes stop_codon:yes gene_type:complete